MTMSCSQIRLDRVIYMFNMTPPAPQMYIICKSAVSADCQLDLQELNKASNMNKFHI